MTKAKISEYDAVASNNTDVNGVNIAEGCPPSGMNNMGREIMAALKRFQTGADGDSVTVGGSLVVSGSVTAANTATLGNVDINGGTIDGTAIGGSTAAAVSATTLNTSGAVVFNDAGADVDFRVEGDTDANLLVVDASTDSVGIGTSSPVVKFQVEVPSGGGDAIFLSRATSSDTFGIRGDNDGILEWRAGGSYGGGGIRMVAGLQGGADEGTISFHSGDSTGGLQSERMRITSAGEVNIGVTQVEISSASGCLTLQRSIAPEINLFRNDTVVASGNTFGTINFYGNDTTSNTPTQLAYIQGIASGTHSAGDNPTDIRFGVTLDGTDTVYEALRIRDDGTLDSQDTYDNTQSGSTVVVTSAGLIGRTSSSIKYKKDVETLDADLVSNAIANLRPVWYRTKDAKGDDKETWSHIGLIAEEVHEVEPRLVRYRTEKVEFVDVEETDENGNTVTRKEKQKTPLETPEPEDVDYGRLAVLCLAKIQELEARIAALEGN